MTNFRTTLPLPLLLVAGLSAGLTASCGSSDDDSSSPGPSGPGASLDGIDTSGATDGIVALPASADDRIEAVFDRYTQFTAPNGGRIHFLSQDNVSDDLLIRTRGLVRQHVFDVPGAALGADKTAALNAMASGGATFVLFEDAAAFDDTDVDVMAFRDLFGDRLGELDASTIVREASASYTQVAPAHDPSIGATALFVLEQGLAAGIPAFQDDLDAAAMNAVTMGIYTPDVATPAEEVAGEYLVVALDTYYGLYGHDPNSNGTAGLNGEYTALDRADMAGTDPDGLALIESFFRPNHRYSAFLDPTVDDTFEMAFDPVIPYTHRSQYLERVGIRSPSIARINGNDLDNVLLGDVEGTTFEGRGGDDIIEGSAGADIAIMSGPRADYTITDLGDNVTEVADTVLDRDGTNQLRGIVQVNFTDMNINL
jgi:hypothetical protein